MVDFLIRAPGRILRFVWTLLTGVLPRAPSSFVLTLALYAMLSLSGDSLGLSNVFRDVPGEHDALDVPTLLASPTAWTSAMIMFAAGIIMTYPCFQWLAAQSRESHSHRSDRAQMLRLLIGGMILIYALLGFAWWRADQSTLTPPLEYARAAIGAVFGAAAFAAGFFLSQFYLDRLRHHLHHVLGWVASLGGRMRTRARVQHKSGAFGDSVVAASRASEAQLAQAEQSLRAFFFALVFGAAMIIAVKLDAVVPAVPIFVLILCVYLFVQFYGALNAPLRVVLVIGLAGWFLAVHLFSQTGGFKTTFAGIAGAQGGDLYDAPLPLDTETAKLGQCSNGGAAGGALSFETAMEAWLARSQVAQGREKPKLLIVATSGGAYRASYWTGLVLDQLIAEARTPGTLFAGLPDAVRFLTGASGGMVGAGYFTAMASPDGWPDKTLIEQLNADIEAAQILPRPADDQDGRYYYRVANPIARDSLSALARQFLVRDAPSLFHPFRLEVDRGKVLERHWQTIRTDFAALRQGEAEGWRPSIILSPMVVETGQPLLVSNLDFGPFPEIDNREATEFFGLFPCARSSFALSTGVRMSATFPYISPATSLPTAPQRRVVDAGYFDNFGIAIVNALLSPDEAGCVSQAEGFCLADWLAEHTSGVIVLEIRAFALNTKDEPAEACEPPKEDTDKFRGFEFFTSPVEAVLSARARSQVIRNDQGWRRLEDLYATRAATSDLPLTRITLVNCAKGTLNWWVPPDEMTLMEQNFVTVWSGDAATGRARQKLADRRGDEFNRAQGSGMRQRLLNAWLE
ncbi:hypothetical protein E4Z66_02985 [Aliishimia ponticola]|uniref:PNPLA domain-containing protein n=1 Tax=Aliishimia ponticola TaxID=2499833 RepID=A0A4S4NQR9_9RHOB|nr:hypothetical protein [Aliishimia ponticola]THH38550.1 hypothetical protein E4Z66_02985 [Aliishimia ponticola]